jgi:hypothetical protein
VAVDTDDLHGVWGVAGYPLVAVGASGSVVFTPPSLPQLYGGACSPAIPLACNSGKQTGSTVGRPDVAANWCNKATPGGEVFYRLDNPVEGTATVELTPLDQDLSLYVVDGGDARVCGVSPECMGSSQAAGLDTEKLSFSIKAGQTYYVVIETVDSALPSAYVLSLACQKAQ